MANNTGPCPNCIGSNLCSSCAYKKTKGENPEGRGSKAEEYEVEEDIDVEETE